MAEKPKEQPTINQASVAKLLMLSPERVRQLGKMGYIPSAGRGKYHLVAVVQGYIKFLKDDERRPTKAGAAEDLRDVRAEEVRRRMAREDRELVDMDEATACFEDVTGEMLKFVNSIPAMITRNPSERRRIEDIVGKAQGQLVARFAESARVLRTGEPSPDPGAEDDA